MAEENKNTLYANNPRVGTTTVDGAVATYPRQFMSGEPFKRAVPHSIRRLEGNYCIAFTVGMKQEGEYTILPPKDEPAPPSGVSSTAPTVAASPPSSTGASRASRSTAEKDET